MPRAYLSQGGRNGASISQHKPHVLQHKPQPHVIPEFLFSSHYEVYVPRYDPVLGFNFLKLFLFFYFLNELQEKHEKNHETV